MNFIDSIDSNKSGTKFNSLNVLNFNSASGSIVVIEEEVVEDDDDNDDRFGCGFHFLVLVVSVVSVVSVMLVV